MGKNYYENWDMFSSLRFKGILCHIIHAAYPIACFPSVIAPKISNFSYFLSPYKYQKMRKLANSICVKKVLGLCAL